ncbi:hypothetical protein NX862_18705 [Rhodobacter sp. KR11]|uniref:DUF6931 family protein n=1 Tax=Rhodobacter sp. KR11 TaxID=2974588 RepID=UPI0022227393|nr:hypothetical protein [Rhodobacter sp. KR11]MCW1920794.1 hypothetical protein [Rhodobacter sp. KR11]
MTLTLSPLRFALAADLLQALPELAAALSARPLPAESAADFLARLATSPIPEEALTFAAQALTPRLAVWWGHECLLARPEVVTTEDRSLLALAARWVSAQDEASRNGALLRALQSPRGPGAWVALGAGWAAPEVAAPVTAPVTGHMTGHMTGQAVATGVLLALARIPQEDRRRNLAQCVVMAQSLMAQTPG